MLGLLRERSLGQRRKVGRQNLSLQRHIQIQRSAQATKEDRLYTAVCVSNRWKSLTLTVEVKWGPRFGKPFDHGFLSFIWRWKTKQKRKKRNSQTLRSWTTNHGPSLIPGCESNQADEGSPKNEVSYSVAETTTTAQALANEDLASEYEKLTKYIQQTICEVVPEKK